MTHVGMCTLQIIDSHLPERKCSSFVQELTGCVVGLCMARITECSTTDTDTTEASVEQEKEIPESIVDESDFECVLCTG